MENKTAELIHYLVDGKFEDRINIGFLENLVSALASRCEAEKINLLKKHYDQFATKYIVQSKISVKQKEPLTHPLYKKYRNVV